MASAPTIANPARRARTQWLAAWTALATAVSVSGAPPHHAGRTPIAPRIDGLLDDACWSNAAVMALPHVYKPQPPPARLPGTAVRLAWDEVHLYIAFACEDDDVWSYSEKSDDTLWLGDVVEFFLKPSREEPTYYEFVIAPNGTLYDARYPSRGAGGGARFKGWSSGASIATRLLTNSPAGYAVESAIPWNAFGRVGPPDGETWQAGAFRYEYSRSFDTPLLLMSIPRAGDQGFHTYEAYEPVFFGGGPP